MHSLEPEDQLWSGIQFDVVEEEDLARQQAVGGDRVHQHDGVWWRATAGGLLAAVGVWLMITGIADARRHVRARKAQSDAPAV